MKDIKIPIISGLSIAATLALIPSQLLAEKATATVTSNGSPSTFKNSSNTNWSGGFQSKAGTHGAPNNNIVTITGNSSGTDMSGYIVYGGGIGDGSGHTGGVCVGTNCKFEQTIAATNNTLNINNDATVWIAVGGEGKGARDNTVNITNSTVRGAVLGGNGTWFGQPRDSGDAIHNVVNISGSSKVLFQGYGGFNNTSVMGGRATGTNQAINNEVNISGTPTIAGKVAGAAVENGNAEGNKVTITGAVTLGNGDTTVNGVIASASNAATLKDNTVTFDNENAKMIGNAGVFGANGNNAGIGDPAGKATAEGNGVILRNGSIESDGKGTIFTTSSCLLAPHRNQPMTRAEIEERLLKTLHAVRIVWIEHGKLEGDDTDGHIDTTVRLAPDDTLLYIYSDENDKHFADFQAMENQLKALRTLEDKPYRLLRLPFPEAIYDNGVRLPATYANFVILNHSVLCPTYAQPYRDGLAMSQLQKAFPGRKIIGIDARTVIRQHGSLHCLTMQFPKI